MTVLLRGLKRGDRETFDRLVELIYPELRKLARGQLRREPPGHLLQPTALVNEAYLRLVAHEDQNWNSRAHFFGAAARVMRRILIDHARASKARKRDAELGAIPLDDVDVPIDAPAIDLIALDNALESLQRLSARQAQIVELRYFTGLSVPEVAKVLGLHARTIDRDWVTARAWLRTRLGQ